MKYGRWVEWIAYRGLAGGIALGCLGCGDQLAVSKIDTGDSFVQGGGHVVTDVLWVIDNSGTMSEEQVALEASLDGFLETLLEADIDFHIGVITTDVSRPEIAGVLQGAPTVLDSDTDDLEATFVDLAMVGFDGSPDERAFDAIQLALSEPLLSTSNAGFLRADASLNVVIISDEDDQSSLSVSEIDAFLTALNPEKGYRASALVGDIPYGCASSSGAADPAPRYLELVENTGGVAYSICSSSYDEMMSRLVRVLGNIQDTFPLSRIADPESIEVEVDGIKIRNRSTDGWQYLPAQNAVRIYGTPLPDPGQEVYISYETLKI